MAQYIVQFVNLLFTALSLAIFGRVLLSWFSPQGKDPLSLFLIQITEPVLAPIRRVVPPMGMFDLTPMIALVLLWAIRAFIIPVLFGAT